MTKTEHYQLNQWDAVDPVRREDFNADNQKIDAALNAIKNEAEEGSQEQAAALAVLSKSMTKVAVGTYVGTSSTTSPTTVSLGFTPKCVFIWKNTSNTSSSYSTNYVGMAVQGASLGDNILSLTESGFVVQHVLTKDGYQILPALNTVATYFYFAIG